MTSCFSAIRFFGFIRLFSWSLFLLLIWGCISIYLDVFSALNSRLPWETMIDALGFIDTLRAVMFPFLFLGALYFGYRCIVNEFQHGVIEVNRHFNRILINAVLDKGID